MSDSSLPTLRSLARHARQSLRDARSAVIFRGALRLLIRDPLAAARDNSPILSNLVYGWQNESWSGEPELLKACIREALNAKDPILECGSGLSTIVLGSVAQRTGNTVWSLEHLPEWADRVRGRLKQFGIDSVRLCEVPLVSYGDYDWYEPPSEAISQRFALVVCDGPPANTRGGRYGLVPVMRRSLARGGVILLDDAERLAEQETVARWAQKLDCSFTREGTHKPYFRLVV